MRLHVGFMPNLDGVRGLRVKIIPTHGFAILGELGSTGAFSNTISRKHLPVCKTWAQEFAQDPVSTEYIFYIYLRHSLREAISQNLLLAANLRLFP